MIRINLSRNLVVGAVADAGLELNVSSDTSTKAVKNALLFLIFPLLIKGVEIYQESLIKQENRSLTATLEANRAEVETFGQTSQLVEKLMREKAELDLHLEQIAHISIERILPLKALDALPALLPERTWIQSLELADDTVKRGSESQATETRAQDTSVTFTLRLEAYSLNPDGGPLFMSAFDKSIFFDQTRMESTTRETSPMGDVSKFALEVKVREGY